jgi:hypothetical protein
MKRPPDIAQDAWFAALKAVGDELERDHEGFHATEAAINTLVIASARAILADRKRPLVLVALNAEGEERAMMNLTDPWPISDFLEIIKGWSEVEGRRIAIRNPSPAADPPRAANISPAALGAASNDDFRAVPVIGSIE